MCLYVYERWWEGEKKERKRIEINEMIFLCGSRDQK